MSSFSPPNLTLDGDVGYTVDNGPMKSLVSAVEALDSTLVTVASLVTENAELRRHISTLHYGLSNETSIARKAETANAM